MAAGLAALASCHSPSSPSNDSSSSTTPAAPSALSITATWDVTADIDLHVVEPSGTEIYWENLGPTASGGVMDGDADQECRTTSVGHKEVVRWPSSPTAGTYTVRLDYYDNCNAAAANYTVTISDGRTTLPAITAQFTGAGDHGNTPGVTVKTFTRTGSSFALNRVSPRGAMVFAASVLPAWPRAR